MKQLLNTLRALNKKGQSNVIKIVSLGVGLAVGLILLSKVFFEQSYDNFYPDAERIYQIQTFYKDGKDAEAKMFGQVSGAIAPGMQAEVPGVEIATRYTHIARRDATFTVGDTKNKYSGSAILADPDLFDILPRPVLIGNAKEVLARPLHALVSKSIADKIGGDVVGKTIEYENYPNRKIIIGGVFEDIPHNSHSRYDVIVSMVSIAKFMGDGRNNWLGNDRYMGYVKLHPTATLDAMPQAIEAMQMRHQEMPPGWMESGKQMTYTLNPLPTLHSNNEYNKLMMIILSLLAVILIVVSIMNYVLIVVSSLVGRSKEIAIRKYFGAERKSIYKLVFFEIFVHLILAIIVAAIIILLSKNMVQDLLNVSLASLFSLHTCVLLAGVCVLIFLFTGLIPAHLFAKIPIAGAIRNNKASNRIWRLTLLFVQVTGMFFLVMLIVIVGQQYRLMMQDNYGYQYKNITICNVDGIEYQEKQKVIDMLAQSPLVESVASANNIPISGYSGNVLSLPNGGAELFNTADMEWVSKNYFNTMEIKIIEGVGLDDETIGTEDVIISKRCADKIIQQLGWTDGVIGKNLHISMHGEKTVRGIYNDIRIGSITNEDKRPSIALLATVPLNKLFIKLRTVDAKSIAEVDNILAKAFTEREIHAQLYSNEMIKAYNDSRQFRDSILIGAIVTLLIAIIGLIGYLRNEVMRRSKEIAIRKINGSTLNQIILLFTKDIVLLSLPALVIGLLGAYKVANIWMEQFSVKYQPSIFVFVACAVIILAFIVLLINVYCSRVANNNPIDALRSE